MTPLIRRGAIQKPATQQLITTAWRVIPHVKSRWARPEYKERTIIMATIGTSTTTAAGFTGTIP
jgi:hypothetical protein